MREGNIAQRQNAYKGLFWGLYDMSIFSAYNRKELNEDKMYSDIVG